MVKLTQVEKQKRIEIFNNSKGPKDFVKNLIDVRPHIKKETALRYFYRLYEKKNVQKKNIVVNYYCSNSLRIINGG